MKLLLSVKTNYDRRRMKRMVNRAGSRVRVWRKLGYTINELSLEIHLDEEAGGFIVWLEYTQAKGDLPPVKYYHWLGVVKVDITTTQVP